MKSLIYLILCFILCIACSDDNTLAANPFVASFDLQSSSLATSGPVQIGFSNVAKNSGYIKVLVEEFSIEGVNTVYGIDYKTFPEPEGNYITLPFSKGDTSVAFKFETLLNDFSIEDQKKGVNFTIKEIDYQGESSPQGYTSHIISFQVKIGGTESPQVGGPNEENQVYFDLSTGVYKSVQRDTWDLGFYSGDDFRVVLNGSIYMAAKNLEINNIDAITENDIPESYFSEVTIGTFDPNNEEFIDNPNGDLTDTAIQQIEVEPNDNNVYLVNLGNAVGNTTPNNGSIAVAGPARGWKKVKILRQSQGYLLQYADLNDTTHKEIYLGKNPRYNFTHFSFDTEEVVDVQPPKKEWDLCFTVFTNLVTDNNGNPSGSYGFSDFVVNNIHADSKAFMVEVKDGVSYENYSLDESLALSMLSDDQRAIGSDWRSVFTGVYVDRFFVINDTDGNWYKIKFLALTDENGERGHPKFEYKILQESDANIKIDYTIL